MPKAKPKVEEGKSPVINLAENEQIKEATKRSINDFLSGPAKKKGKGEDDVILLLSDDDDDDDNNSVGTLDLCGDDDDDDDEVMIIDPSAAAAKSTSLSASTDANANVDDELMVVGENNVMRLPHMRQHCTTCKFVPDIRTRHKNTWNIISRQDVDVGKELNSKTCDLCFCYVCDKPASQCEHWFSKTFNENDHCHASDKGANSNYYKTLRDKVKRGITLTPAATSTQSLSGPALGTSASSCLSSSYSQWSSGPFKPDDNGAKKSKLCTKCRRCGWYSKFVHQNFQKVIGQNEIGTNTRKAHYVGDEDWCHACSRIASTRDFEKEQSVPRRRSAGDIVLGPAKTISFKIKARDPRKMHKTKKMWEEFDGTSDKWKYDEKEMAEDFFKHRIGKSPQLRHILLAIPVVKPDLIPENGANSSPSSVSADETEALLLDDWNQLSLLSEIHQLEKISLTPIGLCLTANWNKTAGRGTIEIDLFLNPSAFVESHGGTNRQANRDALFSRLLFCWYGVDRFRLSDLTGGIRTKPLSEDVKRDILSSNTGLVPNRLTMEERQNLKKDLDNADTIEEYNKAAKEFSKSLSFKSSGRSDDCGVMASSDTTFVGTMKRIASSSLVDDVLNTRKHYDRPRLGVTAVASKLGIESSHRSMRPRGRSLFHAKLDETHGFTTYLDKKDHSLIDNLYLTFRRVAQRCTSMNGILQQLENLGHAPAEHAEGLNVELFDFQRQAVGWALEREREEGGLERFLWTKLPAESTEILAGASCKPLQLYYSPILDLYRKDKPRDVRGGLIAAQMGLGKTVISLSLVLLNPAPEYPISGTVVKGYKPSTSDQNDATQKATSSWPPTPALPAGAPKKRGSIFSRGTLVVCNVSLVGQWIDEAKSKLRDPGLVYSYHGANRNRNAMVLAENGIVVTTYAILSSDANHHAAKSKDPNYCAPCEQVRWWRIIVDESHSIRDTNTKNYKSLQRLTAVNKWAVTGTPMNTTPRDLRGQLNFVGVSYLDKMFSSFANSMQEIFKTGRKRRGYHNSNNESIGPFLFLMRNIMIRHAISQTGRESNTSIMTLPPKEETLVGITFSTEERKTYDKIQKKAASMYEALKGRGQVNRHYLKLNSALLPLRVACSGGQVEEVHIGNKDGQKKLIGNEHEHDIDSNEECSICLDAIEEPRATKCQPVAHIFCKECIEGVFSGAQSIPCPCCRATVKIGDMRDVIRKNLDGTQDVIPKNVDSKEGAKKKKRDESLKESDILFRSKFERLLKELQRVRDREPGSKSLVFSQFTSTLQWMKQELPKHGFQFRTLSGNMSLKKRADALREFQNDPPTTIFLLSMRSGAVGINLTQANRVFLMEPAMNPALEAQAIGRVYRLGQRKPVQIMKMFMKDSFESRLIKVLNRKFENGKKQAPSDENNGEEKKSGDDSSDDKEKKTTSDLTPVVTASLGHMNRDKADMMTEEFDALFGLTEPEDLPDQTIASRANASEDSDENLSDASSPSSCPLRGQNSCGCGNCSGDDEREEECVIS